MSSRLEEYLSSLEPEQLTRMVGEKRKYLTDYQEVYSFFSSSPDRAGFESYNDFLRLLVVSLTEYQDFSPGEEFDLKEYFGELAYHLNDHQRSFLMEVARAASRIDDKTVGEELSEEDYHIQKNRRFGTTNGELMEVPFWEFMVRTRWNAYRARLHFDSAFRSYKQRYKEPIQRKEAGEQVEEWSEIYSYGPAVWSHERFGTSHTRLPDGRVLFIGGEHEDYYDSDFCIYNDVIVLDNKLRVSIYGYPQTVFPPTDFHTATLVAQRPIDVIGNDANTSVYMIGSLGYMGTRQAGKTPVYRLDCQSMQISEVQTSGKNPGWIFKHTATYHPEYHAIRIGGGTIYTTKKGGNDFRENRRVYWLDLSTNTWSGKPSAK